MPRTKGVKMIEMSNLEFDKYIDEWLNSYVECCKEQGQSLSEIAEHLSIMKLTVESFLAYISTKAK